jgi:hypothetical protein
MKYGIARRNKSRLREWACQCIGMRLYTGEIAADDYQTYPGTSRKHISCMSHLQMDLRFTVCC